MQIVAGSYERFLFGWEYDPEQATLKKLLTDAAHRGPVRCLAAGGSVLAAGGSDDTIHLYDLRTRRDLGSLVSPAPGAVTTAALHVPAGAAAPSHLLAGSSEGGLCIWAASGGWECLKSLHAHSGEVTGLAVHPSGAAALTTSRDGTLRMWDLSRGRATFTTKLPAPADDVAFSPAGDVYAVVAGSAVSLHAVAGEAGARAVAILVHSRRVLCMTFATEGVLLTGCDDGSLHVWSIEAEEEIVSVPQAHALRIKGIAVAPDAKGSASASTPGKDGRLPLVATAGSDGKIAVWDVQALADGAGENRVAGNTPLASVESKARYTCLAVFPSVDQLESAATAARERQAAMRATKRAAAAARKAGTPKPSRKESVVEPKRKEGKAAFKEQVGAKPGKKPRTLGGERRPGAVPAATPGIVDFMTETDVQAAQAKQQSIQAKLAHKKKKERLKIGGQVE